MPIRKKIGLLTAKAEVTYALDPTPTPAANAIAVVRGQVGFEPQSDAVVREILDGGFSVIPGDNALPRVKLTFSVELVGNRSTRTLYAAQSVAMDITTDKVTLASHTLINGDLVQFATSGTLPGGLTPGTWYYVVNAAANDFKVSLTSGGAAIDLITANGTGHTMTSAVIDISCGAVAQALRLEAILLACDLAATYTAETTLGARDGYVTYKPTIPSDQGNSVTFYFYDQLKLHKITGAKGTVKFRLEAGKYAYADFEFMGFYNAPSDTSFPTSQVFQADTKPALLVGSSLTWDSYAPILSKINVDLGNKVQMRQDATAADGVGGFIVTSRESKGDFDPEAVAEASNPFWANWKAATVKTFTIPVGAQSGNRFTFTLTAQARSVNYADRNEVVIHNCQFALCRSALSTALSNDFQLKIS